MNNLTILQKIVRNPITRIILGIFVCIGIFIIAQNITTKLLDLTLIDRDFRNFFKGLIASIAGIGAYKYFYKLIEKRKVTEIAIKGIAKNVIIGITLGVVLQCLTILVIYLNNGFKVVSINPVSFIIIPFTVAFTVAIFEEILLRGIIFRIVEEKLGSTIALIISALIFGGLHLANPNSSFAAAACIAVFAGLLLGAAYIYTRNLWFPIAIHFAWNFMQSGIFGAITSGNEKTSSLLVTKITGPTLITGGEFGPEATIQATVLGLITALVLLYQNKKQNKFIKPYWKRKSVAVNR